ncbi:MAG: RNA-binding domain-containing protein [Nitrosopumilaceae archaeon]
MVEKLEISIDIIVHATEDVEKILEPLLELFNISNEEFSRQNLSGHFENPITLLHAKIKKKDARNFLKKLVSKIPENEFREIIEDIQSHIQDSTLHLRFGKQELIKGKMVLQEKDAIKFKIFTPVYKKTDVVKNFVTLLTEVC